MWVRLDDQAPRHPKLLSLGPLTPAGGWLWLSAMSYCSTYLTDGHLTLEQLRSLWVWQPPVEDVVAALVGAGMFEERGAGRYYVHDYLDYNPSKQAVLEVRRKKALAGQAGGKQRAKHLLESRLDGASASASALPSPRTPTPSPTPSQSPTPTPSGKKQTAGAAPHPTNGNFIAALKANQAYAGIDIDRELGRMDAWLSTPAGRSRKKTRRFIVNWLNRIDQPMPAGKSQAQRLWDEAQREKETP